MAPWYCIEMPELYFQFQQYTSNKTIWGLSRYRRGNFGQVMVGGGREPSEHRCTGGTSTGAPWCWNWCLRQDGSGAWRSTGAPEESGTGVSGTGAPQCHTNVPQPRRAEPPDVAIRSPYRCSSTSTLLPCSLEYA